MRLIFALAVVLLGCKEIKCQNSDLPWWLLLTTDATETVSESVPGELNANLNLNDICCECVPFYQCDANNSIITDGGTILGPRIGGANRVFNVETCPDPQQLCCRPRTAPPTCVVGSATNQTRPEDTGDPCECIHWEFCLPEFRVSDGSVASTFIGEEENPLPAHARCQHSLTVCCALDLESPTPPESPPPVPLPGDQCICVNPWLCDAAGNVITDGTDLMNLRRGAKPPPCASPQRCCRLPEGSNQTPGQSGTPNRTRDESAPRPDVVADQRCQGIRNPQGISVRIAGFQEGESQFGEFPWAGMVLRTYFVAQTPMNAFIGGAILVHPRVVLTAAHKVANEPIANLTVRVGEWDIETDFEPGQYQSRSVERVILHPQFNPRSLSHDVALVVLSEPVQLQSHIRSICLAQSLDDVDGSACVINGWGKDSFSNGNYQTVMKSVTIPLVENGRCQTMLRKTRLGVWFELHPSFQCAGGELGKDACSSDGGGPLACPRRGSTTGEYLLVGITAWGIGCGEDGVPGVYASTIADRSWITSQLEGVVPDIVHTAVKRDVDALPAVGDLGVGRP